jgi:hypothetical protein
MLLNASSFLFKLSNIRIQSTPIIWPEGRWHSMIFAYRSIFIMFLFLLYWETNHFIYNYMRGPIILGTIYSADVVTNYYKNEKKTLSPENSTMRYMPHPSFFSKKMMKYLNTFYSMSQVLATMNCLFSKNIDGVFILLFPIQIAMFLMTLAKKNIITSGGWHLWYSISLLIVPIMLGRGYQTNKMLKLTFDEDQIYYGLAFLFSYFRFRYNTNKYYLWIFIIMIHWYSLYYYNMFRIPELGFYFNP